MKTTWKLGDPLPTDTLWTRDMVAAYAQCSTKTVLRRGVPRVPGMCRYDPATVRAFFASELDAHRAVEQSKRQDFDATAALREAERRSLPTVLAPRPPRPPLPPRPRPSTTK